MSFETEKFRLDNGIEMLSITSENDHEARKDGSYEDGVLHWLYDKTASMDTYIDAGSFCGFFPLHMMKEGVKTVCFEPSEQVYEILLHNLANNRNALFDAYQKAVSNKTDEIEMGLGDCGFCEPVSGIDRAGTDIIETTTLNDTIDVSLDDSLALKIDTEGYELKALDGANQIIDAIDWLVVEYHPGYVNDEEIEQTMVTIQDYGFVADEFFNGDTPYRDNCNVCYVKA